MRATLTFIATPKVSTDYDQQASKRCCQFGIFSGLFFYKKRDQKRQIC